MEAVEEIKKNLDSEKLLLGQNETLKNLKLNKVEKVFLASNCDEAVKKEIEYYCGLNNTEVVVLDIPNDEIGIISKRQYSISVLCLLKQ